MFLLLVSLKQCHSTYLTSSTVEAGLVRALVRDSALAVGASVAGRAATSVWTLAGVEAGGSVAAGLVVGAVVQVLVAEEAAPSVVAVALPGVLARSVFASRISDALIAEWSGPAATASETKIISIKIFRLY